VTTSTREATRRAGFRERWTLRQWERLKDLLTAFGPTANVHRPFLEESLLWTALWTGYPAVPNRNGETSWLQPADERVSKESR
jgi:hypothetical protein